MKNKNTKKRIEKQINNSTPEISTIIKISVGVILFFIVAYLIMAIITGEISFKKEEKKKTEIQYEEILAANTFDQKQKEYYVVFYDMSEKNNSLLEAVIGDLKSNNKVYKVDLDKKFNEQYIDSNINYNANSLEELKVSSPTLIKISNGKIEKVIFGADSISKYVVSLK